MSGPGRRPRRPPGSCRRRCGGLAAPVSPEAKQRADEVAADIRRRRVLALMLGDTSMGMINGYFGPRLLAKHGFAEHKVDQAWLPHRLNDISADRVEQAFRFVKD